MSDQKDVFDMAILRDILAHAAEPAGEVRTVHWDDVGYTTLYRLMEGHCAVEFACYRQTSAGASGEPGDPRWYGESAPFNVEDSPPLAWEDSRVQPVLAGDVKWDGCSNWDLGDRTLHFCGRRAALALAVLLDRCYALAREVMGPGTVHDPEMFEGDGPSVRVEVSANQGGTP